jgi:3-oxoacyl-[acyl-carrier protein] reductase
MKLDFEGQTALVTGASRGIGHQIACDLAACGATLIVTSTSKADAARLVEAFGPSTQHFAVDFTDAARSNEFISFLAELDELQVCVNNAGTTRHGPLEAASPSDWDATHNVDLKAPFFVSQAAAEVMKRGGYGRIVNIASIWAHQTMVERALYTAAKFGLRGMTMSFAVELARHDILVNAVAPGFTLTDMVKANYSDEQIAGLESRIPLGRLGKVEEVSRAVLFLASELNSYITGQSLVVDGGYTIA